MARRSQVEYAYEPRGTAIQVLIDRSKELLVSGPAGTGKAQPLGSLVLTPNGSVPMSQVGVGTQVLTPTGLSRVVNIPFRGVAPVYRVTLSDGSSVECSDGHLWKVGYRDSCNRIHEAVLPLAQILQSHRSRNGSRPKYWIPLTQPVEFVFQPITIPAYTLGVLLGDGHLRYSEIGFTSCDQEIVDHVRREISPRYKLSSSAKSGTTARSYRIQPNGWRMRRPSRAKAGYVSRTLSGKWMARVRVPDSANEQKYVGSYDTESAALLAVEHGSSGSFSKRETDGDGIAVDIINLGLEGTRSATKFVPDCYKYNTSEVRLAILQGLMDTDGYAGKTEVCFTSVSKRLADDVRWLVESLGGFARITTKQPANGQLAYNVWIRHPECHTLFRLNRKRERCLSRGSRLARRWIERIEFVGEKECQCITVENEDGLYLTENFIVTHNSRACLEKLYYLACTYPNMRGLIVRQTRASLTETGLVTWEKHVIPPGSSILSSGASRGHRQSYEFPNGSQINCGGLDKPDKIMSSEYDCIYVQEATELKEDAWGALSSRLRNGKMPYDQLLADCNPSSPMHWLKKRCELGECKMIESRHEENPRLHDGRNWTEAGVKYLARLDALPGVLRDRLRYGKWRQAEGAVYENWDARVHIVDPFPIPHDWPRYLAIDFGFTNPCVVHFYATDPDGRLYLYREIYRTKTLIEDIAREVKQLIYDDTIAAKTQFMAQNQSLPSDEIARVCGLITLRPKAVICDHDAEDRKTFEKHSGLPTRAATKAVTMGINTVAERLQVREDGKPRLMAFRDARYHKPDVNLIESKRPTCTVEEMDGYVWSDSKVKEQPVKEDDHGCFVAGTMIDTDAGLVPIESVAIDDKVLTRDGYKTVLASGMTSDFAKIMTVKFSDGRTLTGTGNHPIWVEGLGFTRLDLLRYNDVVITPEDATSWKQLKSNLRTQTSFASDLTTLFTADIRRARIAATVSTTGVVTGTPKRVSGGFTATSGSSTTVTSRTVMRFTTKTTTPLTTSRPISNALRRKSITLSTFPQVASVVRLPGKKLPPIYIKRGLVAQQHGIVRRRAERGTESSKSNFGPNVASRLSGCANIACNPSRHILVASGTSIVPHDAGHTQGSLAVSMTLNGRARSASSSSVSINIENRSTARRRAESAWPLLNRARRVVSSSKVIKLKPERTVPVSVLGLLIEEQRSPVYNLTVEGSKEYFANGVLVHNCDNIRYTCVYVGNPNKIAFGFA